MKLETLDKHMASCQEEIRLMLRDDASAILSAKEALSALSTNFDVRKVAACVKEHQETCLLYTSPPSFARISRTLWYIYSLCSRVGSSSVAASFPTGI